MARLDLNVASRPFVNERPLSRATAAVVVLLLAASFANAYGFFGALHESRTLRARLVAARTEAARALAEAKELGGRYGDRERRRLKAVAESTTAIIERRRLSWSRLFDQLEMVLPRDVRILRIVPGVQGSEMVLVMECFARDDDAMQRFYSKLHEPPFRDAYILGEMVESDKIRFQVRCRYETQGGEASPVWEKLMPWELAAAATRALAERVAISAAAVATAAPSPATAAPSPASPPQATTAPRSTPGEGSRPALGGLSPRTPERPPAVAQDSQEDDEEEGDDEGESPTGLESAQ
jgi:Tfp pilus assembly protein PilN